MNKSQSANGRISAHLLKVKSVHFGRADSVAKNSISQNVTTTKMDEAKGQT
jgi:hypothetical protein